MNPLNRPSTPCITIENPNACYICKVNKTKFYYFEFDLDKRISLCSYICFVRLRNKLRGLNE